MSRFDQAKMLMQARKLQKELSKTLIEVEAGAVTIQINGEQKIQKVTIDPEQIDLDDISELENSVKEATKAAIEKSQKVAAEKMQPMMGMLGGLGM